MHTAILVGTVQLIDVFASRTMTYTASCIEQDIYDFRMRCGATRIMLCYTSWRVMAAS